MTHKRIHRFQLKGIIGDDADFIRLRNQYENLLTSKAKAQGHVRVLDIDSAFSVSYNEDTQLYDFLLTIHTVYVGKAKAWHTDGMQQGRLMPKTMPHHKLNQYLKVSE